MQHANVIEKVRPCQASSFVKLVLRWTGCLQTPKLYCGCIDKGFFHNIPSRQRLVPKFRVYYDPFRQDSWDKRKTTSRQNGHIADQDSFPHFPNGTVQDNLVASRAKLVKGLKRRGLGINKYLTVILWIVAIDES